MMTKSIKEKVRLSGLKLLAVGAVQACGNSGDIDLHVSKEPISQKNPVFYVFQITGDAE